jgi:hypothetical protein
MRTDGHDEAIVTFCSFANAPKDYFTRLCYVYRKYKLVNAVCYSWRFVVVCTIIQYTTTFALGSCDAGVSSFSCATILVYTTSILLLVFLNQRRFSSKV